VLSKRRIFYSRRYGELPGDRETLEQIPAIIPFVSTKVIAGGQKIVEIARNG
jgi:hypothetical protein